MGTECINHFFPVSGLTFRLVAESKINCCANARAKSDISYPESGSELDTALSYGKTLC